MPLIPALMLRCGLLLALVVAPSLAAARESLLLKSEVFKEITVRGADGKSQKKRVTAQREPPGTEVVYVITYLNTGDQPANKVVVSVPVPAPLTYKGGSGSGKDTTFEVSVDGGKSFGALAGLKVSGAGGATRHAQAADVTHLRWTLAAPVGPGKQGSVSYRAVLK